MKIKFEYIIFGIVFFIAGIHSYKTGWVNIYEGPIPKPLSILACISGVIIVLIGLFSKPTPKETGIYICENCQKKYKGKWVKIEICSICNGKLKLIIKPTK